MRRNQTNKPPAGVQIILWLVQTVQTSRPLLLWASALVARCSSWPHEGMLLLLVMAGIFHRGSSFFALPRVRVASAAARHRTPPRFAQRTRDMLATLSPPRAVDVLENRALGKLASNVVQGKVEKVSRIERRSGQRRRVCVQLPFISASIWAVKGV